MHLEYKFKISIVMAIYNVETYLEESIQSIIEQDIGFKNIQLILIDDGSKDSSGDICKKYSEKYEDNITYIKKYNGGVSSARNLGLNYVEGKYVNFLDGDDLLSKNTCRIVYDFFENNIQDIDIVSIPMIFFDGKKGGHILNYKFKETRVVDIKNDYKYIQLSSSSAFVKASALQGKRFDEKMKYGEDAKLITQIIIEKMKYGVISEAKYFYRIRKDNSSTLQNYCNKDWYLNSICIFSTYMLEIKQKTCYNKWDYIDYITMYELQWKINKLSEANKVLNKSELTKMFQTLDLILKNVSVKSILNQKYIRLHRKIILLMVKFIKNRHINMALIKRI